MGALSGQSPPWAADSDDPVKCVERIFATCKALHDRAGYCQMQMLKLRDDLSQAEAQALKEVLRVRGGIEAQVLSLLALLVQKYKY